MEEISNRVSEVPLHLVRAPNVEEEDGLTVVGNRFGEVQNRAVVFFGDEGRTGLVVGSLRSAQRFGTGSRGSRTVLGRSGYDEEDDNECSRARYHFSYSLPGVLDGFFLVLRGRRFFFLACEQNMSDTAAKAFCDSETPPAKPTTCGINDVVEPDVSDVQDVPEETIPDDGPEVDATPDPGLEVTPDPGLEVAPDLPAETEDTEVDTGPDVPLVCTPACEAWQECNAGVCEDVPCVLGESKLGQCVLQ